MTLPQIMNTIVGFALVTSASLIHVSAKQPLILNPPCKATNEEVDSSRRKILKQIVLLEQSMAEKSDNDTQVNTLLYDRNKTLLLQATLRQQQNWITNHTN